MAAVELVHVNRRGLPQPVQLLGTVVGEIDLGRVQAGELAPRFRALVQLGEHVAHLLAGAALADRALEPLTRSLVLTGAAVGGRDAKRELVIGAAHFGEALEDSRLVLMLLGALEQARQAVEGGRAGREIDDPLGGASGTGVVRELDLGDPRRGREVVGGQGRVAGGVELALLLVEGSALGVTGRLLVQAAQPIDGRIMRRRLLQGDDQDLDGGGRVSRLLEQLGLREAESGPLGGVVRDRGHRPVGRGQMRVVAQAVVERDQAIRDRRARRVSGVEPLEDGGRLDRLRQIGRPRCFQRRKA